MLAIENLAGPHNERNFDLGRAGSTRIVKDDVDLDPLRLDGRRATQHEAASSSSDSSSEGGKTNARSSVLSRISEGDENDSDGVKLDDVKKLVLKS